MKQNRMVGSDTLFLVAVGIALNLLLSKLVIYFDLPIFLDSVGTILAAALGGYLPGVTVGFFTNYINSVSDPITVYYAIVSVLFAIMATFLSARGMCRKFWQCMADSLLFALVGGGLGSVLTWLLYGRGVGQGISAPFARLINDSTMMGEFMSQFSADMAIDVVDKLITFAIVFAALRLAPRTILDRFALGGIYYAENRQLSCRELYKKAKNERHARIRVSLLNKVSLMVIVLASVLIAMAVIIASGIYEEDRRNEFVSSGRDTINIVGQVVDGDDIDYYIENGPVGDYWQKLAKLQSIRDSLDNIEFLYIVSIEDDCCGVIFDTDSDAVARSPYGEKWMFEEAFIAYKDELQNGESIPPVESSDKYGWLYSIYEPMRNSNGKCVAYMAVDILMTDLVQDKLVFSSRVASMLLATSIFLIALILWFIETKFVKPITSLTDAASKFAYDSEADRNFNSGRLIALNIKTGDEIEDLYHALIKTTSDVGMFITQINDKTKEVENKVTYISKLQDNIILSFANIVENRDEATGTHIKRTAAYVTLIAKRLRKNGVFADILTDEYITDLTKSAPLHDIGKIKIPESILNKPGKLTSDEFEIIKTHTTMGREVLDELLGDIESGGYLSLAKDMAASHHERWNGKGYPKGLKGEEIPLCARIMSIADVFDALVSKRSYKEPFPFEEAKEIIDAASGEQFDPAVVAAFDQIAEQMKELEEENL